MARQPLALLLAVLAVPSLAGAAEFEVTGYAGYTFPFYKQTFTYDPGPVTVPIPGVTVDQGGSFALEASGAPAFAGGATFYLTGGLGLEVRYDRADLTVDTKASSYTVRLGLPAPLEPFVADLALAQGTADLKAAAPFSINLKLRTPGSVRFFLSGGASHLGDLEFTTQQTVGLGVIAFDLQESHVNVGTIGVKGTAVAESSWGGNLGLGLQIAIGEHAALVVEGRGFYFPKRKVEWEPVVDRPLNAIELALLARLQERLPPVEFEPWWVQATAGFAVRF
jgi:outer membrane protein with beta-barrel domain